MEKCRCANFNMPMATGTGYTIKKPPAKPDIDSCFWHGHKNLPPGRQGCKYFVFPKTRTGWWLNKINGNIANDVQMD